MDNELSVLLSDEFRGSVESNLDRDPMVIALDGRVANAALVASQVKYLRRAKEKLPSWYTARCVLPGRAFEQSSGEAAALRKNYSGRVAVDLTCGLGVDSWALSRGFEWVIALERDPFLAAVARENFRRLDVGNVLVVNALAEDFLRSPMDVPIRDAVDSLLNVHSLSRVDLVYADPDRRSAEGRKMVRLEDCSPDLVALLPAIERLGARLVAKLSPLFDVAEAARKFGSETLVEVISVGGECKEIIVQTPRESWIRAVAVGLGEVEYPLTTDPREADRPKNSDPFEPDSYKFLVVPDVALQKSRLAVRYYSERGVWIDSDNGYGFAAERPSDPMGRVIDIQSIEPFDPKGLKRRLKAGGVGHVEILKRNFPLSADELTRALGLATGSSGSATLRVAFTSAAAGLWQITLA